MPQGLLCNIAQWEKIPEGAGRWTQGIPLARNGLARSKPITENYQFSVNFASQPGRKSAPESGFLSDTVPRFTEFIYKLGKSSSPSLACLFLPGPFQIQSQKFVRISDIAAAPVQCPGP